MATAIPENTAAFTEDEILRATGAHKFGSSSLSGCIGVTTDSRGDVAGKLFVALSGERFDGHRYVEDVLARGAYGVLVEGLQAEQSNLPGLRLRVTSTLEALGQLACAHRVRWGKAVVTIGGSAGKTTTRAAVEALLVSLMPGRVHATIGNLNNLVGVPMTLLALGATHDVAVIEVGTNQRGEVGKLSAMCLSNVAVLTCIGLEHSEGLGDLDGIEAEEGDLFRNLAPGAALVGLGEDERVVRLMDQNAAGRKLWTYGRNASATHRIELRTSLSRERFEVTLSRNWQRTVAPITLVTRLTGLPGAFATAAALAVADALSIPIDESKVKCALDRQVGETGRLRILERSDRALVIDDCYNANPISMRSSIAVARELAEAESRRLVLVLGDMRELGDISEREHVRLVEALDGATDIVAIGPEMAALAAHATNTSRRVTHFENAEAAMSHVRHCVEPKDVILVKGSRGVHLETIVRTLTEAEAIAVGDNLP